MAGYENRKGKNPPKTRNSEGYKSSQLLERRKNRGSGETADWANASPEALARAVANVTNSGCTIQFGYTKDGGAYSIRLYDGNESSQEFVRPTEDIDLYLTGLAEDTAK